ncbi:SNF5-domain-containing protein, partial [Auricularia subglabra TFB-10046 SS5]
MANSQYPMHMQQFAAQNALPYQQQQQQQQQFPQQQAQQQNPALSQQHNMAMQFNGLAGQQKFPQPGGFPGQQQHGQLNGAGAGVSPAALQQMGLSPSQYQQMAQMKMAMSRGASNGAYPQQGQQGQQGQQPSFDARAALMHQQQQQNAAAMPPPRPQTAQQNFGSPTPPMSNGFSGMQAGGAFGQGQQSPFINQGMGRPDTPHHQQQQQQFGMPGTPQISRPPTAGPSSQIQPRPLSPSVTGAMPESPLMRGAKRKASELGTPGPGYAGSPTPQPAVVDMKVDPAMQFTAMDTPARPSTAASQIPSTPAMMGPPPAVGGSGISPLAGPGSFATPGPSQSPLAHRRPHTGMNGMRAPSRAGSSFMGIAGGSKPALPGNANPDVTKVTKVALAGSGTTIPPLTGEDMANVKEWLAKDEQYAKELQATKDRMRAELRGVATRPPHWFEEDNLEDPRMRRKPKEKLSLLFPADKRADRDRKLKLWRKSRLYVPRTLAPADAKRQELLVPIRLEFDVESHRFRETFVWNMHDPIVTPEIFAQSVCDDFALPPHQHSPTIVKMINDQLADFRAHTLAPDPPTDDAHPDAFVRGKLSEADEKWWANWRKRLRTDRGKVRIGKKSEIDPAAESMRALGRPRGTTLPLGEDDDAPEAKAPQEPEEDLRIVVNIDILVGSMNLKDQFEWDIVNSSNSPEHFAEVYCSDLGLGGEFKTAVAHCIREQSQVHMKSLFVVGHPMDGTPILEEEVKQTFLPPIDIAARSFEQTSTFTPIIDYL